MTDLPHITFAVVAGPFDLPLMLVVLGTMAIALALDILGLVSWLRGRR
jgi:hypothetical protein